jgi:hypothetical protein
MATVSGFGAYHTKNANHDRTEILGTLGFLGTLALPHTKNANHANNAKKTNNAKESCSEDTWHSWTKRHATNGIRSNRDAHSQPRLPNAPKPFAGENAPEQPYQPCQGSRTKWWYWYSERKSFDPANQLAPLRGNQLANAIGS